MPIWKDAHHKRLKRLKFIVLLLSSLVTLAGGAVAIMLGLAGESVGWGLVGGIIFIIGLIMITRFDIVGDWVSKF
jgi:hypothetical protein